MKNTLKRGLGYGLLTLVLALLGVAALLALAIERQPRIPQTAPHAATITPAHIERAVQLFERHDPRRLVSGSHDTVNVSQEDLDLALNYVARRYGNTSTQIALRDGGATLQTSTPLPRTPFGRYLNVRIEWQETTALPRIAHLRIGRLPVSPYLANHLLRFGVSRLAAQPGGAATAVNSLQQVHLGQGALGLDYLWRGAPSGASGQGWWSATEQARIDAYTRVLTQQVLTQPVSHGKAQAVPLTALVRALLQEAAERSRDEAAATAENRAAIVALALFVNAQTLQAGMPPRPGALAGAPAASARPITLGGRTDTAQHFTVSAALAATAGSPLSDAVGLYKELNDARGGSGFSFNDLAADRAGTYFGERATAGAASARKLQQQLGQNPLDGDLLPRVRDLPEGMQQVEFTRRFGGVNGAGYRRLRAEIEQRIAALPLYR